MSTFAFIFEAFFFFFVVVALDNYCLFVSSSALSHYKTPYITSVRVSSLSKMTAISANPPHLSKNATKTFPSLLTCLKLHVPAVGSIRSYDLYTGNHRQVVRIPFV